MKKSITQDPLFKKGARVRKSVLGAAHVNKRIASANQYTEAFEEFNIKAAWGLVWSRPGLSLPFRSLTGLRPNSPPQTTSVSSKRFRCFKSAMKAASG